MKDLTIADTAVLLGFSPEATCVYSALVPLEEYWDGEHPWDESEGIQRLRLEKLRGYLFDSTGQMIQEFETVFDLATGIFKSGWTRHADGTFQEHRA
jgi:hypothetical protein